MLIFGMGMTMTVQVRGRGNVTLPASLYRLGEGDALTVVDLDGAVLLSPRLLVVPRLAAEMERLRRAEIAEIGATALTAPLDGILRVLTRDGVPVTVRTKIIEVDPRGSEAEVRGIGERPRRIAEGVLQAIRAWATARGRRTRRA